MTVAVGMVCSDGVLVASDSMGSSGLIARQVTKVHAFKEQPIIWTRAGSEFVTQRVRNTMASHDVAGSDVTPLGMVGDLTAAIREAYGVPQTPPTHASAEDKWDHSTELLVLSWGESPSMIHVPADLAAIECSERWFATIGSGHDAASAVQAALAHYSRTAPPTLERGCLIAYRLIEAVCSVSSWGVGVPVQIAVADSLGARILSQAEIDELDTGVERWLETERVSFMGEARHKTGEPTVDLPRLGSSSESDAS
jgi:hypothetical protein